MAISSLVKKVFVKVMIDCNTGKIKREEALNKMSKKYDIEK